MFKFILTIFIIFLFDTSYAECLKIDLISYNYEKSICADSEDISANLQELIDNASNRGGGIITFSAGIYKLRKPIYLRKNVSLIGKYGLTKILLYSDYGFIINNEDIVDSIIVKDLTIENTNQASKSAFLIKGGLQNSKFQNLKFYNFKNQILFYLNPEYNGKPPRNIIFNEFMNIYADSCNKCVVYNGTPHSLISENVWINIKFMAVFGKAIEVINWVDTEKWYNLYAKAVKEDVILIDINANNLEHAHGFHFYSPTLVYDWSLIKSAQKPVAIRFGKNTIRNIFIGVSTDKKWDKFFIDDGAYSYYILMDTVEDRTKLKPPQKSFIKIIEKGSIKEEIIQ